MNLDTRSLLACTLATLLAACSTAPPSVGTSTTASPAVSPAASPAATAPAAAPAADKPRVVRSRDGSFNGEMVGMPTPGSLLARLEIGMTSDEVIGLMKRPPDRSHTYESGKRWIPLYFGNDARRMQVLYQGEGCLIYAAGSRFGAMTPELIRVDFDRSGKCYQP